MPEGDNPCGNVRMNQVCFCYLRGPRWSSLRRQCIRLLEAVRKIGYGLGCEVASASARIGPKAYRVGHIFELKMRLLKTVPNIPRMRATDVGGVFVLLLVVPVVLKVGLA